MAYSKVFFADFSALIDEQAVENRLQEVPEARQARIRTAMRLETKASLLASGLLLRAVLQAEGLAGQTIAQNEYGKPYFADLPTLHFNLSHSGTYVALVLSDAECGIDIEEIDAPHDMMRVADRFFSPFEYGAVQMSANPAEAFCRLWTLREAYVKMRGLGFAIGLSTLRCDFHRGVCTLYEGGVAQTDAHFSEFRNIYGYRGAICTAAETTPEIRKIEL